MLSRKFAYTPPSRGVVRPTRPRLCIAANFNAYREPIYPAGRVRNYSAPADANSGVKRSVSGILPLYYYEKSQMKY